EVPDARARVRHHEPLVRGIDRVVAGVTADRALRRGLLGGFGEGTEELGIDLDVQRRARAGVGRPDDEQEVLDVPRAAVRDAALGADERDAALAEPPEAFDVALALEA